MLWTDELKFELFGTNRKCLCSDKKVKGLLINAYPRQSIMEVGILWFGVLLLERIGRLVKIDRILDKKVYHKILVRHAVPSVRWLIGNNFVFKEDNDPKNSSNCCRIYLETKEAAGVLTFMNWPAQILLRKLGK